MVGPAGNIEVRGPLFEEAIVTADLNLDEITDARAEAPLLADLRATLPDLIKNWGRGKREEGSVRQAR